MIKKERQGCGIYTEEANGVKDLDHEIDALKREKKNATKNTL